jgi:hypothetical protein
MRKPDISGKAMTPFSQNRELLILYIDLFLVHHKKHLRSTGSAYHVEEP